MFYHIIQDRGQRKEEKETDMGSIRHQVSTKRKAESMTWCARIYQYDQSYRIYFLSLEQGAQSQHGQANKQQKNQISPVRWPGLYSDSVIIEKIFSKITCIFLAQSLSIKQS